MDQITVSFPPERPAANVEPPEPPKPEIIKNAAFWPNIDAAHYRETQRQEGQAPPARLREALIQVMAMTNRALLDWATVQRTAGFTTLADVPNGDDIDGAIDGESTLIQSYRRAVYSGARAILTEQFRGTDTTGNGDKRAQALELTTDELWRQHQWAINDVQSLPHATIDLL